MHIGLQMPSFKYPGGTEAIRPRLKEIAQTAEAAGFYSLWVMDHFYQINGLFGEAYDDPMLEAYTTLGYLAGVTESARLGTMVTGVIYRYPAELIKEVSTLDILSGGRAYLSIGAAWYKEEAEGFGMPFPEMRQRYELLEDALQMAHAIWKGETRFSGHHVDAPAMTNNPAPLSQPHPPILIGGMGPNKTLKMVAQYADACNFLERTGEARMQQAMQDLKRHCDDLGRDFDSIEKTCLGTATLAAGQETVEGLIERIHKLKNLGFSHVIFDMPNVYEITPLQTFGEQIIPAVKDL